MLPKNKKIECFDSDLQSDNPDQLQSGNEPPQDKVYDIKLIKKFPMKRYHKQILKVGTGISKPAKYDLVQLHILLNIQADKKNDLEKIQQEKQIEEFNLGFNKIDSILEDCICEMKKGEIILFITEHLKLDESKLKVLDYTEYQQIHLIDWITVVDLFMDMNYLKKILKKGYGIDRCDIQNDISFQYTLFIDGQSKFNQKYATVVSMHQLINPLQNICEVDKNVWNIMKTMKQGEHSICEVNFQQFKANANSETFKNALNEACSIKDNSQIQHKIQIEIEIFQIIKIDDVFGDQSCLKRILQKGKDSTKPEMTSLVFFDYKIYNEETHDLLYNSSSDVDFETMDKFTQEQTDQFRSEEFNMKNDLKCIVLYLDEFKISRLLKKILLTMGRNEICDIMLSPHIKNYITYGQDYDSLKNANSALFDAEKGFPHLHYIIRVYSFTEGLNAFIMTLNQKIQNAIRKKAIGINLLNQNRVHKALKIFENINSYFELGKFTEEEKMVMFDHQLSSILNTSLCYQKLKKWDKVIQLTDKVLQLDKTNIKGLYRKALALKEQQKYKESIEFIENVLQNTAMSIDAQSVAQFNELMNQAKRLQQIHHNKEKQMYSNLFK